MSTRFTPLESDILDALAWDLRDIAPDLAGQFAESLAGARRNTGCGLFTELIVDRFRPPPLTAPTGRFGSVHAMVGDLPDPIAFQVELRQGRLMALHGDAYGQDTRALDFARIRYDQIFTVDDRGESVAFDPAALMQPGLLTELHQHADDRPELPAAHPLQNSGSPPRVQDSAPHSILEALFGKMDPASRETAADETPPGKADQTTVLIGLWVIVAVVVFLAVALFDVPIFFALLLAGIVGRMLHKPKVIAALTRATRRLGQYEYRPPQQ